MAKCEAFTGSMVKGLMLTLAINKVQTKLDGNRQRLCLCLLWPWPLTSWSEKLINVSRPTCIMWPDFGVKLAPTVTKILHSHSFLSHPLLWPRPLTFWHRFMVADAQAGTECSNSILPHNSVVEFLRLEAKKLFSSVDCDVVQVATWATTIVTPQIFIAIQLSLKPAAVQQCWQHSEPVERPPCSPRRGPHVYSGASCYVILHYCL